MSIAASGQLSYTATLTRSSSGGWIGQAHTLEASRYHPGAAGTSPEVRLVDGTMTLRCTESPETLRTNSHYLEWGPPKAEVSFPVGPCVESVVQDGDVLTCFRGGTADLGVLVERNGQLAAALGAVATAASSATIHIEEDPGAADGRWAGLAASIANPDTQLILLDASASDAAAELQRSLRPSARRLVVAIYGGDADRRRQVNNQIAAARLTRGLASVHYASIDERFPDPNDWLAYLHEVTDRRRHDLWIRFTTSGGSTTLREDRYEYVDPWHLFVLKVYRPGIPGERSQLAVVRQSSDVTKAAVIRSTEIIARGDMTFRPMRLKKGG